MIKFCKDLFKIFKNTYQTYYAEKIKAKLLIKDYQDKVNSIENVGNKLYDIANNLHTVYYFLPIKEREDFVQKTLNLINYGDEERLFGYGTEYKSLLIDMKNNLKILKLNYNNSHYNYVIGLAEIYNKNLEEFFQDKNIKKIINKKP